MGDILKYTVAEEYAGDMERDITDVTHDSRQVKPGTVFVAVPGYKTDGHLFIRDALAKGAAAIVLQDRRYQSADYPWIRVQNSRKALAEISHAVYGFPSTCLNMVGVTGTNGKTTTANLIAAVLEDAGHCPGLIGTIYNRIGGEIIPVQHTTPEAPDLHRLLVDFLRKGADYVVMEVSSHALELHRVKETEFDVAVFTNLTQDHLDFHQDMEQYLASKGKLFAGLGHKSKKQRKKFAIINNDDPAAEQLKEMATAPVITYGIRVPADVKADEVKITDRGASFILKYTNRTIPVNLRLTGLFNVYNSLAAIAVGLVEGIPAEDIVLSLERVAGIAGRFEKVEEGQNFSVIVDYSHTPDSLENCLKTAREFAEGRIITVFGCGGNRDRTKRPLMGAVAGRLSDFVIVTSDNPRSEEPQAIIDDIMPGLAKTAEPDRYTVIIDRKKAISYAISQAKPKDVVIIAGKGHEDYQIIKEHKYPFDDRLVAKEAIREKLGVI